MRVLQSILFSVACASAALADGPFLFGPPTTITFKTPHGPAMVAAGDLDGDGDLDLVVPGRNNEGIAYVVLNDDGAFATPVGIEIGTQCDWVEIADIDNDSHADLVFALRSNHGRIVILWGRGNGTFEEERLVLRLQREPRCVAVADFNGDGQLDLAAANYGSSSIQTFLSIGNRTFAKPATSLIAQELIGTNSLQSVRAGDLDGDGLPDLAAVTIGSSHLYMLRNRGDGTFGIPEGWKAPQLLGETGGITSLALGDLDNDGDLEATVPLIFLGSPSQFGVFENNGEMSVASRLTFDVATVGYAFSLGLGDLDGDGDLDSVVGCAIPGSIKVLDNRTSESTGIMFEPPQTVTQDSFIRGLVCADMDDDCDLDIVAVDFVSNSVFVLWNLTPQENGCGGSPFTGEAMVLEQRQQREESEAIEDLNGDGVINGGDLAITLAQQGGGR